MTLLQVNDLTKNFAGLLAVDRVSFALECGTINSLVGPNGSGKTTLLGLVSGLHSPSSGRIVFEGEDVTAMASHKLFERGISRTFQEVRLFQQMSVLDNILLSLGPKPVLTSLTGRTFRKPSKKMARAWEILKVIGLEGDATRLAGDLSFGQRKLLEIGRCVAPNPKLLLLDEPLAGLFPEMVRTITCMLEQMRDSGVAILLVEHNMGVIRELSQNVIVLDSGRKIAEGQPEVVLKDERVIEAFLGK